MLEYELVRVPVERGVVESVRPREIERSFGARHDAAPRRVELPEKMRAVHWVDEVRQCFGVLRFV